MNLSDLFNNECLIYDIKYTEKGFVVDKYRSKIITRKLYDEVLSYRTYRFIGRDYPDDLPTEIKLLKEKGYKDIGLFVPNNLVNKVICPNYLLSIKLHLMERNCQLLEKVYDIVNIDNNERIRTFIIYVDIKTGIVYQMNMGILGSNVESNIMLLQKYAYVNYQKSKFFNNEETENHKSVLKLTHKKGDLSE